MQPKFSQTKINQRKNGVPTAKLNQAEHKLSCTEYFLSKVQCNDLNLARKILQRFFDLWPHPVIPRYARENLI
jgi:hypothetical protein